MTTLLQFANPGFTFETVFNYFCLEHFDIETLMASQVFKSRV